MNLLTTVFCVFGFMTVIFLRMRRIYKVYSLYDAYMLDQKNDLDMDREEDYKLISSITTSINSSTALSISSGRRETEKIKQYENARDLEYMTETAKLTENNLIRQGFLFVILPASLVGALSWFFPYVYAVMPVPNSAICICQYFFVDELDLLF